MPGGRYELLEHLLDSGAAELLDELMVEWHGWRHTKVLPYALCFHCLRGQETAFALRAHCLPGQDMRRC